MGATTFPTLTVKLSLTQEWCRRHETAALICPGAKSLVEKQSDQRTVALSPYSAARTGGRSAAAASLIDACSHLSCCTPIYPPYLIWKKPSYYSKLTTYEHFLPFKNPYTLAGALGYNPGHVQVIFGRSSARWRPNPVR
jgi:hypothetical protein